MNAVTQKEKLTAKDFATDQEVRWCPGCGDYAILKAMQKAMADMGQSTEDNVFVSGIGCAARFPYYMATYGFHTIHGRAPAFATGIKLANPDLNVWVVGGDGDMLSIGANHLMHVLRRNVDLQVLLFNNEIYGLTKGQYSPTSREGTKSPSTPLGSVDRPIDACTYALGAGATFIARGIDSQQKHLPGIFQAASEHKGASFVEVLQNCIVYNDGVFNEFTDRDVAADRQVHVEAGKPLIYGADGNKGIRLNLKTLSLEEVVVGENGVTEADLLVHDPSNHTLAGMLAAMNGRDLPVALGVLYCSREDTYEAAVHDQINAAKSSAKITNFNDLLRTGHTWVAGG
ncbi:2-oxoacid:ferredoxin oxidoreductase subunit beta [Alphaproteobacteria bacterium HT1-32]|nr:2-oxoacid:ferredoxin oxidoreductase subunit beta [Alphaproteobacteria bacterium HT1-32]